MGSLTKTKILGVPVSTNNWNMPQQIGSVKANPNKESNNLIWWIAINSVLIFFIVVVLFENAIISTLNWILDWLTIKYVGQFLLFLLVMAVDGALVWLTRNVNAINGGFIAVILYYVADYYYLSKEWVDFSLLNMDIFK